jgi:hypothetical protein
MATGLTVRARLLLKMVRFQYWLARKLLPDVYANDGLISFHRHAFLDNPDFQRAYQRGAQALAGPDWYQWHWRVHVGLWVAKSASLIDGDFVECGVNYGFLSTAIMELLDWDRLGKTFYLLDTFAGLDPKFTTTSENRETALKVNEQSLRYGIYINGAEMVRANFAEWKNHRIIVGAVPETLEQVDTRKVAYLHIDMNCAPPEVAALRFFWPRLAPGAFVLLDDYNYRGFDEQRLAMDALAKELGVAICALPTGQGLLMKPAVTPNENSETISELSQQSN